MRPSRATVLLVLSCALTFAVARGTLHLSTYHLPLSNDDAIPMIQSWMLLRGEPTTTLINQPYNGALDSWLLAPALLFLSSHTAFRLYELAAGLALVAACAALAARAGGAGGVRAAALLAALGTPYMGLMTALGPVPNFLVPLLVALALRLLWTADEERPSPVRGVAAGLVAGLAAWDSALAVPALAGALVGLLITGRRSVRLVAAFAAGFAVGASPLLLARAVGAAGESTVMGTRSAAGVAGAGLAALGEAAAGLFGVSVPLVVDGPERAALPAPLSIAAGAAIVLLAALGGARRESFPLVGWAAALAAAFALSSRTGPHEVRYLYGLTIPVIVLVALGLERLRARRGGAAYLLALPIAAAWIFGHATVLRHWRDPRHAAVVWQVPPLEPALARLAALEAGSAYASLQFAGRLTVESSFRSLASQAWNERIPGDPLRFRDEVDLDPAAVWVLSPRWSRGMPRSGGFHALLQDLGGTWREEAHGDVVLFHGFVPPFDEARPVPRAALRVADAGGAPLPASVLDRDATTAWTSPSGLSPGAGLVVRLDAPRRLSAVVLGVGVGRSPLGVPWVATADGAIVARGPRRYALQWVGGVPRAAKQALLTVVLPGREVSEVKILFQDNGPPLTISEIFAYGSDEPRFVNGGDEAAARGLAAARANRWAAAVRAYEEAARQEPDRASFHHALVRARHRAAGRQHLDVESLDDGGVEVVGVK